MAIEHADSFDIYGTDASLMTDGVYAQVSSPFGGFIQPDPDGESTQRCIRFGQSSAPLRYALLTPVAVVGQSCRIWMPNLPTTAGRECIPFEWRDIDNNRLGYIAVQTNGAVKLIVDDVEIVSTNVPVLTAEAWWHMECKVDVATGTCELRIEDVTVIDEDSLSFPSAVVYQLAPRVENDATSAFTHMYMKDFVVWNTLGSDNTDFLGPVRVINLWPNEDVTIGGWAPSTGTEGYPILDNNPPLNSEYMSAAPAAVDDFMQFEMTDLPDDITAVKGVVTFVRARKVDGGYGQLQTSMVGDLGAESAGLDRPITAGYVYWRDVHERDPDTDAAWTRVGVDNSNIKIDRTL